MGTKLSTDTFPWNRWHLAKAWNRDVSRVYHDDSVCSSTVCYSQLCWWPSCCLWWLSIRNAFGVNSVGIGHFNVKLKLLLEMVVLTSSVQEFYWNNDIINQSVIIEWWVRNLSNRTSMYKGQHIILGFIEFTVFDWGYHYNSQQFHSDWKVP